MKKYAKIINEETGLCEVGVGTNKEFYKSIGMVELDVEQSEVDSNWYVAEKCLHYTEEELAQKEKERIALLKMTPRDFLLAITSMGIEWAQIKALMSQNPQVEIELNYCQYVYRGNPLLDDLCGNFGVTPEQLDELFLAHENISLTTSQ